MIKIHLNIHQNWNRISSKNDQNSSKYSSNWTGFFDSQNPLVVFIAPAYRHHPPSPPRRRLLEPAKRSPFLCAFWLVKRIVQFKLWLTVWNLIFCYLHVIYRKIFNFTFNLPKIANLCSEKRSIWCLIWTCRVHIWGKDPEKESRRFS